MRFETSGLAVLTGLLLSCGSTRIDVPDASTADTGADVVDPFGSDGSVDAETRDAAPLGYTRVDGGTDCGLPARKLCNSRLSWSCCNGAPCRGDCALFPDASQPVCYCAGLTGGCPGTTVCCPLNGPPSTCVADEGLCTLGPPCP